MPRQTCNISAHSGTYPTLIELDMIDGRSTFINPNRVTHLEPHAIQSITDNPPAFTRIYFGPDYYIVVSGSLRKVAGWLEGIEE